VPGDHERYISCLASTIQSVGESSLVYVNNLKYVQKIPTEYINVLKLCNTMKPIGEHWDNLRVLGRESAEREDLIHIMKDLARLKLLISEGEINTAIRHIPRERSPGIAQLCWPTANRPGVLEQSILSFLDNLRRYDRSLPIMVMDNSTIAELQKTTRAMLSSLAAVEGVNISYAGTEEKQRFIKILSDEISREGIDPKHLQFALQADVPANGANRNAVLLATLGEIIAVHDDDIFCRCGRTEDFKAMLKLQHEDKDLKIRFFEKEEDINSDIIPDEIDLIGEYEKYAGGTCAGIVSQWLKTGSEIDWEHSSPRLIYNLTQEKGTVLAAAFGRFGDAGSTRYHALLNSRDIAVNFNTLSVHRYIYTLCSGMLMCYSPCYSIYRGGMFTNDTSLDNRKLIPPFFPLFRNQDGLMGKVLYTCYPDDIFLRIPYSLFHRRDKRYSFDRGELRKFFLLVSDYISMLIMRFRPSGTTDPEARMISLGRYLDEIGQMPAKEFTHYLRAVITVEVGRYCKRLEEKLEEFNYSPKFWAEDVEAHLKEVRRSIAGEGFFVPLELQDMQDPEAAQRRLQELISGFGKLLTVWPGIREAALRLSAHGVHIAEQL